jgi:hypothetical protein
MEAATPRADVDGALDIPSEDWREAPWRLTQRCGQRVVMLGRGGERGVFPVSWRMNTKRMADIISACRR